LVEEHLRDEDGFEDWMLSAGIEKLKLVKKGASALAEEGTAGRGRQAISLR
jgi:hypothetical protein